MLKAVGNNVLVRLPKGERVSNGGIVIPHKDRSMVFVTVISVGEGWGEDKPPCKPGDVVLIPYYLDENIIKIETEEYVFTDFHNVLCVKES